MSVGEAVEECLSLSPAAEPGSGDRRCIEAAGREASGDRIREVLCDVKARGPGMEPQAGTSCLLCDQAQ